MPPSRPDQLFEAAAAIDRIAQAHRTAAATALRDLGVGESTAGLLWLLGGDNGCTMGEAAERLACDRSNVTLLATQLERRGFVERTADPVDARRRNLRLTPDGQRAAAALRDAVVTQSPLRHLSDRQCRELVSLLGMALPDDSGRSASGSPAGLQEPSRPT